MIYYFNEYFKSDNYFEDKTISDFIFLLSVLTVSFMFPDVFVARTQ